MNKRILVLFLLVALVLTSFVACGKKKVLTSDEAQKIAIEYLGISESEITDIHPHVSTQDNAPGYSFHITCGDKEYSVFVDAATGEVKE